MGPTKLILLFFYSNITFSEKCTITLKTVALKKRVLCALGTTPKSSRIYTCMDALFFSEDIFDIIITNRKAKKFFDVYNENLIKCVVTNGKDKPSMGLLTTLVAVERSIK